jgi:hypothetical protein
MVAGARNGYCSTGLRSRSLRSYLYGIVGKIRAIKLPSFNLSNPDREGFAEWRKTHLIYQRFKDSPPPLTVELFSGTRIGPLWRPPSATSRNQLREPFALAQVNNLRIRNRQHIREPRDRARAAAKPVRDLHQSRNIIATRIGGLGRYR